MYADWYEHISAPWRAHPRARRALAVLDRGLVYLIAAVYLGTLMWLCVRQDVRVVRAALVPAATFALVTVVRSAVNEPRPYETYAVDPLIHKDTHGKSFPSRHLASAVIIACALTWLLPPAGIAAFVACAVVAYCRIVGGVHYPRDVVAAALIALACGALGFFVL